VAEQFGLGYLATGGPFGMIIASLGVGYVFLKLDPIHGFWLACIFARPLGTIITSALLLVAITAYLSVSHDPEEPRVLRGTGWAPIIPAT
jgi:uncharacterized membrane-anchored protein